MRLQAFLLVSLSALTSCESVLAPPPESWGAYEPCCGGIGSCMPTKAIPEALSSLLEQESCKPALSCVPNDLLSERQAPSQTCVSSTLRAEGRCLAECLPSVRARRNELAVDGCMPGTLCVPCFDPVSGAATHACELGADPGPQEPPRTFAECCGGEGRCVPSTLAGNEVAPLLSRDSCLGESELCVAPRTLIEKPGSAPTACRDEVVGFEGRCLPSCLPLVAQRASSLRRTDCSAGSLCVPCFDPITGLATGACTMAGDPGPALAPTTLASCCGGQGRCAPSAAVPAADRSLLGQDACGQGFLCVAPEVLVTDPEGAKLTHCADPRLGVQGRCLPACLPSVAARADSLVRASCGDAQLCVPCFDPFTGEATGACELGPEQGPKTPPFVLASCCGGQGQCAPSALVPEASRSLLGQDSCDTAQLCVAPEALVTDPSGAELTVCRDPRLGLEGRCLPDCLPSVAERASSLVRAECAPAQLCVPCFDPVTGVPTGSCELGPKRVPPPPPVLLPACCGGQGRCTPRTAVPNALSSLLGPDSCSGEALCVAPVAALTEADFHPARCKDPEIGFEGRCLPDCLPQVAARASQLRRADCEPEQLCVPCFDPVDGTSTGACLVNGDTPAHPQVVLEDCCTVGGQDLGICVSPTLLPSGSPSLAQESCTQGMLCAPKLLALDPNAHLPSCAGGAGACLPLCFLSATQSLLFSQDSCAVGEECVPCDFFGSATGVCKP